MPPRSLTSQVRQLRQIWDELIQIQPQLRATVPADIARARMRLRQLHATAVGKASDEQHPFLFYRIGALFARQPEPLTMGQIADALGVPMSTATRLIDWLVENEYLERLPDPNDRRIVRVAMTDAGKQLYATFNEYFNQRVQEFLRHFTPEERAQLVALSRKTVEVLRRMTS